MRIAAAATARRVFFTIYIFYSLDFFFRFVSRSIHSRKTVVVRSTAPFERNAFPRDFRGPTRSRDTHIPRRVPTSARSTNVRVCSADRNARRERVVDNV